MRNHAALASCLLLIAGVATAQSADGSPSSGAPACGPSEPRFIRFELTDGVGAILINPSMVAAVESSAEKPKDWSQIRWADGHTSLVQGAPEVVSQKLTRPAGSP